MSIGDIFASVRAERKSNEWLFMLLMEHLETERTVDCPGPSDWLSASKVPTLCPRAHVICWRLGIKLIDTWNPQGRWMVDRGTALHIVIQEMWLGPMGYLLGGWKCHECARVHTSDMKPEVSVDNAISRPDVCIECGFVPNLFDRFSYIEPWIKDELAKVRGRTDGIIDLPARGLEILDIKTTSTFKWVARKDVPGDRSWDLKDGPKIDHVKQLHWYMGPTKIRNGRLLYVNPAEKRIEKAIIEHKVTFDPALYHEEREKIVGLRKALEDETRPVPDCPYGRVGAYGDCSCVEVEDLWSGNGH